MSLAEIHEFVDDIEPPDDVRHFPFLCYLVMSTIETKVRI